MVEKIYLDPAGVLRSCYMLSTSYLSELFFSSEAPNRKQLISQDYIIFNSQPHDPTNSQPDSGTPSTVFCLG